ncbi:host HNS inhibition protein [Pseudomonas phage vB_PpuP-Mudajogi]|uniref:Host HNS inhibition protein n=1 Tax=Pseudomonas phage vB_PpuP-Mudajogi TaxID=3132683 RepID=A0AAX4NE48_9CAUD
MAKTLKLTVNFPMSVVVKSEIITDFQEARKEAREILASGKVLRGHTKYRVELMASDKTDEQCFEQIYREGIREFLKKDMVKELQGNESRIRVGDIRVVYADQSVLARSCDCNACFECKIARGGSDE